MHSEWFKDLKEGDIIRHNKSGEAYIVVERLDWGRVVARVITATNPAEWTLVFKSIPAIKELSDE